jgi:hypothetical protein
MIHAINQTWNRFDSQNSTKRNNLPFKIIVVSIHLLSDPIEADKKLQKETEILNQCSGSGRALAAQIPTGRI